MATRSSWKNRDGPDNSLPPPQRPPPGSPLELELELLERTRGEHPKGKALTPDGLEVLDPRPMAPPIGWEKQPSMVDHIRNLVKSELLRQELNSEAESFEEADDFEVGDPEDIDPQSGYEAEFEPEPPAEPPGDPPAAVPAAGGEEPAEPAGAPAGPSP